MGRLYAELRLADLFRFDYTHHSDAPFRPVWRKCVQGYERASGGAWHPDLPASMQLDIEVVEPGAEGTGPAPPGGER